MLDYESGVTAYLVVVLILDNGSPPMNTTYGFDVQVRMRSAAGAPQCMSLRPSGASLCVCVGARKVNVAWLLGTELPACVCLVPCAGGAHWILFVCSEERRCRGNSSYERHFPSCDAPQPLHALLW